MVLLGSSGDKGRGMEGSRVRVMDDNTGRLSGLQYKLICYFKLAVEIIGRGIREFFLKRELV